LVTELAGQDLCQRGQDRGLARTAEVNQLGGERL
jgi:hypothetical protein